ncbi:unnamed protein product [Owenia fusiformis]|uniref:Lipocalin/cytosolic fatty-acid binding domain-containing protein n=1 Tax=Owenia fusiformis TaxID=6347 RepID=A0A8S4P4Q3_OWEFU|nr:unnamed protein product [Owenia fusiformis]
MFGVLVFALAVATSQAFLFNNPTCRFPAPAKGFKPSMYQGRWYEVGKIQTAGGAVFQEGCHCTYTEIEPVADNTEGEQTVANFCNKYGHDGEVSTIDGKLFNMKRPGEWQQSFFPFVPPVDYRIIVIDDKGAEYAIEYDCGTTLSVTNYCIHILSRTPTLNEETVQMLLKKANEMDLNPENLPFERTPIENCKYNM